MQRSLSVQSQFHSLSHIFSANQAAKPWRDLMRIITLSRPALYSCLHPNASPPNFDSWCCTDCADYNIAQTSVLAWVATFYHTNHSSAIRTDQHMLVSVSWHYISSPPRVVNLAYNDNNSLSSSTATTKLHAMRIDWKSHCHCCVTYIV
jgi:hypothetical protein